MLDNSQACVVLAHKSEIVPMKGVFVFFIINTIGLLVFTLSLHVIVITTFARCRQSFRVVYVAALDYSQYEGKRYAF